MRDRMVDELARVEAATDAAVLAAMRRVRRHAFVPHFWTLQQSDGQQPTVREWNIDPADITEDDAEALALAYDIDGALSIRRSRSASSGEPIVTSSASAPRVVAWMLEQLHVRPGLRVLEIGTGSGYNAALLRELVGPGGFVASVDIDASLVSEASARLEREGYDDIVVRAGDGYDGLASHAPFDRVVATVGCLDVAPAWLAQLRPRGLCLLPLQHSSWHPLTRVALTGSGVGGSVISPSGFVSIQGRQAQQSPWPNAYRRPLGQPQREADHTESLSDWLAAALTPEPGRERIGSAQLYDLSFLLAVEDRRTVSLLTLVDEDSRAWIDPIARQIHRVGPRGSALQESLLGTMSRWRELDRPRISDYSCVFTPLDGPPPAPTGGPEWTIDRVDYRQTLRLGDS